MGGLARRASLILERRKNLGTVLVDSGDLFFRDQSLAGFEQAQASRKARAQAEGARILGYDLVCPGEADFAQGLAAYRKLVEVAGVTPLCANLRLGNEPVFAATAIREIAGVRIGFLGVLAVQRPLPTEGGKPLFVEPLEQAAARAVADLAGKVDLVVALSHQGLGPNADLARKVRGIDVIVGGHTQELLGGGMNVDGTAIYQAGYRGQHVGTIRLEARPAVAGRRPTVLRVAAEAIPMAQTLKDEPRAARLVADYNAWVKTQPPPPPGPPPAEPPSPVLRPPVFWMAPLCGHCHPRQDEFWKGTIHSQAYATLVKKQKQLDLECLPCHTTGFAQTRNRSGNRGPADVTGLESVQCEACHGPGSDHKLPTLRTGASRKETCVRCHDARRSPGFDLARWLPRIRCPAGSK